MPKKGISQNDIEENMNLLLDWIRYDENCYVVYSNSTIRQLNMRFRPLVEPDGRLFICELNIENRNGWMAKSFWSWIRKERQQ
jgi:hypothetical protein